MYNKQQLVLNCEHEDVRLNDCYTSNMIIVTLLAKNTEHYDGPCSMYMYNYTPCCHNLIREVFAFEH